MQLREHEINGIKLIGGFQFWSNPALIDTDQAIPIILCRPTFIDLYELVIKYGAEKINQANEDLFQLKSISDLNYTDNKRTIRNIQLGLTHEP